MLKIRPERRRYGRIRLDEPLRARFGDVPARAVEMSVVAEGIPTRRDES